jgi:chromosome segregation ATPase|tara:strand:+ start:364 stop:660 length:297 start_codon:yes stop_codon:yes gene_type:complete
MNQSEEQVKEVEKNVILLLNKLKDNYFLIQSLQSKLKELESTNSNFIEEINLLKQKNKSLSVANSLLGSDENKAETKDKINSLIKEIDSCINQLESSF